MRCALAAGALLVIVACVRPGDRGRDSVEVRANSAHGAAITAPSDTARGIVEVTGPEPAVTVIVRDAAGRALRPTGDAARELASLEGLEVWISGTRTESGELTVAAFAVRAMGELPARDGVLQEQNGSFRLRHQDGSLTAVVAPSAELRRHVGTRVWTAGDPARAPEAFGIVRPIPR